MIEGNSWAELRIDEKATYRLPQEAMLDICDLKDISGDDLFLMLMDQKLSGSKKGEQKMKISDVSIPRGKLGFGAEPGLSDIKPKKLCLLVFNGIKSLYDNAYFPNAVAALKQFLERKAYREGDRGDAAQLYLAKSFEALKWYGRAIAAYQNLIRFYPNSGFIKESQNSIERLKKISSNGRSTNKVCPQKNSTP